MFVVFVLSIIGLAIVGALLVWEVGAALAYRRKERALFTMPGAPLKAGPYRCGGRVIGAPTDPPVVMRARHEGLESRAKGNGSKTKTRSTEGRPFYIEVAGLVEPIEIDPADARLVIKQCATKRSTAAEGDVVEDVRPGDYVYVSGPLTRSPDAEGGETYRGGGGWLMRAAPDQKLLVCCARKLGGARGFDFKFGYFIVEIALVLALGIPAYRAVEFERSFASASGSVSKVIALGKDKGGAERYSVWVDVDVGDRPQSCQPWGDSLSASDPVAHKGTSVRVDYRPSDPSYCRLSQPWERPMNEGVSTIVALVMLVPIGIMHALSAAVRLWWLWLSIE